MAPKVNCNPQKLTSVVSYLQRSRTVHNIKDLEKHLPAVASISGMQVKDYLQSLQDESKIRVEKIGSGNWYWSFASEEKKSRQKALDDAKSAHEKATSVVDDLKRKLAEAQAQRDDEAEMLDSGGESREEINDAKAGLEKEIKAFEKELAAYSENDPTELERKNEEIKVWKGEAEQATEEIESMEGWLKKEGGPEVIENLRVNVYGDEYDEEEGGLREICWDVTVI